MPSERVVAESTVSGNQTEIPARIRQELSIEDGDRLSWIREDGTLRLEVLQRRGGTFADFDGYDGDAGTDATDDHDAFGVE